MHGIRVRRPFLLFLSLLFLLLPMAWGCNTPQSGSSPAAATSSSTDEAERTRKMQDKAAEIDRKAEEIRNMQGTEQEKIDAMNELEKMRQELNQMQDSGAKN